MNILSTIWNTVLYQPLHNLITYLYIQTGSIGLSTFILILIVRGIILSPLVAKQQKDTKKMRSVQPRLQELKEKYGDDPKKMSEMQQKLYKEINYNPAGCFTNFLIQIPIYIAIYNSVKSFIDATPQTMEGLYPKIQEMLLATGEKAFATDLWGVELFTSPSSQLGWNIFAPETFPYIVLILLFAIANVLPTLITRKLMGVQAPPKSKKSKTASETEEMQEMLSNSINQSTTYLMPIMMTFMMLPLPSVIHVYMIINGIISTTQQLLIKNSHNKKLRKKLTVVFKEKFKLSEQEIEEDIDKIIKLPSSVDFLADELAEFGEFKSTDIKAGDIQFAKVLKRSKNHPIEALIAFGEMAQDPDNAEKIMRKL